MDRETKNMLWIGGIALGAVAIAGGIAWAAGKPAATPSTPPKPLPNQPPGASYDASKAVTILLAPGGGTFTVPVGSSITAEGTPLMWNDPGVATDNAAVVAPSIPLTTNGFYAASVGTAKLTGSYMIANGFDPNTQQPLETQVTVTATVNVVKSL